jgi:PncC family amidohydrolase
MANGAPAQAAVKLVETLRTHRRTLVTAESCTAGLAAALVAEVPGASAVLWGGYVTYTEDAKKTMLGVSERTLALYGAVSGETALEMARGALRNSPAAAAAAVTGLAGPDGDGSGTPVGTVWMAAALRSGGGDVPREEARRRHYPGMERNELRRLAAEDLLEFASEFVSACGQGDALA